MGGERHAGTMGGMFFITNDIPAQYRRFAVFKRLAEHAAPRGFDVIGLERHHQSMVLELAYAKLALAPKDYAAYLKWRESVERSNFFQIKDDSLIDKAAQRMKEIFQSLPQYLTYRNKRLVDLIQE